MLDIYDASKQFDFFLKIEFDQWSFFLSFFQIQVMASSEEENMTQISAFILLGFGNLHSVQYLLFGVFLVIYVLTLMGNIVIVTVVLADLSLHSPMYFFLGHFSFLEIGYTTTIEPMMLRTLLSDHVPISFPDCARQFYFFSPSKLPRDLEHLGILTLYFCCCFHLLTSRKEIQKALRLQCLSCNHCQCLSGNHRLPVDDLDLNVSSVPQLCNRSPSLLPFPIIWAGREKLRRKIDKAVNSQKLRKSLGNFCLQVIWPIALLYVFIVRPFKKKTQETKKN